MQFVDAKAKISEQSKKRYPEDVLIEVGNTEQTVPIGQLIGFNGDYILQMHISLPANCKNSEELKTTLTSEYNLSGKISEITILWSSWKDVRIDVLSDYSGDLRDYFNPP